MTKKREKEDFGAHDSNKTELRSNGETSSSPARRPAFDEAGPRHVLSATRPAIRPQQTLHNRLRGRLCRHLAPTASASPWTAGSEARGISKIRPLSRDVFKVRSRRGMKMPGDSFRFVFYLTSGGPWRDCGSRRNSPQCTIGVRLRKSRAKSHFAG